MTEQPTPEQVREKIASAVPMTPNPEPVAQADLVEWLRSWKPGDQHSYCDTAATEIERLRAEIASKDEALRECVATFDFYEQSHLTKGTQDGDEKAYRNKQMADKCRAALKEQNQ